MMRAGDVHVIVDPAVVKATTNSVPLMAANFDPNPYTETLTDLASLVHRDAS